MSGGRPAPVIGVLMSALVSGFCLRPNALQQHSPPSQDNTTSSAVMFDDYRQALCRLCETLVKRMVSHNNIVQMTKLTTELCGLLRSSGTLPRIALMTSFQLLMIVCPFVADIPVDAPLSAMEAGSIVVDTSSATTRSTGGALNAARASSEFLCIASSHLVVQSVAAYLLSSDGEICGIAAQVLATMIGSAAIDSPGQSVTSRSSAGGGGGQHQLISSTLSPTMLSIIDDAKCWISYATFRTTEHTPLSVIGVTNLITSLVSRLKWESLSYVIPWVVHVQQLNAVGLATSPPNQPVSSSNRNNSRQSSSSDKNTALQQAWLFSSLVVLKVVGDFLHVSKLSSYASDVVNRRREMEPCEIGLWFRPTVQNCTPSTSGIAEEPGEQDTQLAPLSVASVTNLFTLSTVVLYLCEEPESSIFLRSLDVTTKDDAVAKIESIAGNVQHHQRQQQRLRDGTTPRRPNSAAANEGTPNNLSIKRSGSSVYSSSNPTTVGGRIPINHSFGDLAGKREDSSVLPGTRDSIGGLHASSNSSFGAVTLPRNGGAGGGVASSTRMPNEEENVPASEKIRMVLQKLKSDSAGGAKTTTTLKSTNANTSLPFQYHHDSSAAVLTPSSVHLDPWKESGGSKNNSFTMSVRDGGDGRLGLNGSIVMPTAKTLRLAAPAHQRPQAASSANASFLFPNSTFGGTFQTTANETFEDNNSGIGSNPVRRRFLQVLEL
ncbi:Hypothetical protein, putative [Bodo saltans]|uniref:GPI-anchored surface protein n=1 Tax=Bodo saltans TaxID=75058 RepID=A0A0S4JDH0_BODSA|nr:Hypothetical protein, putative [Bodo saltans]|eukprot:CUG87004.1 Hypothetical protein, putative [Bodo saltans]